MPKFRGYALFPTRVIQQTVSLKIKVFIWRPHVGARLKESNILVFLTSRENDGFVVAPSRTSTNEELSRVSREQASFQHEGDRLGPKPKAVSHDKNRSVYGKLINRLNPDRKFCSSGTKIGLGCTEEQKQNDRVPLHWGSLALEGSALRVVLCGSLKYSQFFKLLFSLYVSTNLSYLASLCYPCSLSFLFFRHLWNPIWSSS